MAEDPAEKEVQPQFVGRVELNLDRGKARGAIEVKELGNDAGEWEYVLVARVPALDLQRPGEKPLLVRFGSFRIVLRESPSAQASQAYRFVLRSGETPPLYRQEKTVKDNLVPSDLLTTLEYNDLLPGLSYTLEWWLTKDARIDMLHDEPFASLMQRSLGDRALAPAVPAAQAPSVPGATPRKKIR